MFGLFEVLPNSNQLQHLRPVSTKCAVNSKKFVILVLCTEVVNFSEKLLNLVFIGNLQYGVKIVDQFKRMHLFPLDRYLDVSHPSSLKFSRIIPLVSVAQVDHHPKLTSQVFSTSFQQVGDAPRVGGPILTSDWYLECYEWRCLINLSSHFWMIVPVFQVLVFQRPCHDLSSENDIEGTDDKCGTLLTTQ